MFTEKRNNISGLRIENICQRRFVILVLHCSVGSVSRNGASTGITFYFKFAAAIAMVSKIIIRLVHVTP